MDYNGINYNAPVIGGSPVQSIYAPGQWQQQMAQLKPQQAPWNPQQYQQRRMGMMDRYRQLQQQAYQGYLQKRGQAPSWAMGQQQQMNPQMQMVYQQLAKMFGGM